MAKIKLVASDLDGTLLTSQKKITRRLSRALEQLDQLGIYFVPATGRAFQALPDCVRRLPNLHYVITCSGASVYDAVQRRMLFSNPLPPDAIDEILQAVAGTDHILEVMHSGNGYIDKRDWEKIPSYSLTDSHIRDIKTTRIPSDDIMQEIEMHKASIEQMNFIFRDTAHRQQVWATLQGQDYATFTYYSERNIEITGKEATKANALKRLCEMLEIDAENVLALGDGDNDVDMLYWAGASAAVANAPQHVKDAANILTESCDEDGAAIVLDRVIAAMVLEQLLKRS